jgi:hypothetical protein
VGLATGRCFHQVFPYCQIDSKALCDLLEEPPIKIAENDFDALSSISLNEVIKLVN